MPMQTDLLIGLSRQVALSRQLDVVANNIANMNTTGFKADGSLFEEYLNSTGAGTPGAPISFVRDRATWTDMSHGPIERTGNPLDVAINGDGFFAVQTSRGVRYTRAGSFQVNATGQIVTADGDAVLGDNGPITLQPNDREVSISPDGTVSVRAGTSKADTQRGKLHMYSFANLQDLKKDGAGTFNYTGTGAPQDDTKSTVVQGAIEKSNVRGVLEMTRMIDISRSYMQISAMLQQQNDLSTNAVDKLSEVPN
jgi:flagellar basal-body rod protein FlgF